jgi:type II secretory pathway pseudopilin PulG
MWWMIVIGIMSLILLSILMIPMLIRAQRNQEFSEARLKARQLRLALFEFETEYGKFPDSSTAAAVRDATGNALTPLDGTSNDFFAQLLASGIVANESLFYAKTKGTKRKPDNIFNTEATTLEHGECTFAYISGLSAKSDPNAPIAFGAVIPGSTALDKNLYQGNALVLTSDSVSFYPINSAGKIIVGGLDLLDPRQPFWHGKAPDVKWPK